MRVLVACEFSGVVRDAFLRKGHNAFSCDILPTESNKKRHIQGDVLEVIEDGWDLMIAHPPCTYLSTVGNRALSGPHREERLRKREDAFRFFISLWKAPIPKICIENPVGYVNTHFLRPDQIVHPYHFGESVQKRTCLWLLDLPKLSPTNSVPKPDPLYICLGPKSIGKYIGWTEGYTGSNRSHGRSRSFLSIATAMASQWG